MKTIALLLCTTVVFAECHVCQAETPQQKINDERISSNKNFNACKPKGWTSLSIRSRQFNDYYKFWPCIVEKLVEESQEKVRKGDAKNGDLDKEIRIFQDDLWDREEMLTAANKERGPEYTGKIKQLIQEGKEALASLQKRQMLQREAQDLDDEKTLASLQERQTLQREAQYLLEESQELLRSTAYQLKNLLLTGHNPKRANRGGEVWNPNEAIECLKKAKNFLLPHLSSDEKKEFEDILEKIQAVQEGKFLERTKVDQKESIASKVLDILNEVELKEIKPNEIAFFFDIGTLWTRDGQPRLEMPELLSHLNANKIPWFIIEKKRPHMMNQNIHNNAADALKDPRIDAITRWTDTVLNVTGLFLGKVLEDSTYKDAIRETVDTADLRRERKIWTNFYGNLLNKIETNLDQSSFRFQSMKISQKISVDQDQPFLLFAKNIFILNDDPSYPQHKSDNSIAHVLSNAKDIKHIIYVDSDPSEIGNMEQSTKKGKLHPFLKKGEGRTLRLIWCPETDID